MGLIQLGILLDLWLYDVIHSNKCQPTQNKKNYWAKMLLVIWKHFHWGIVVIVAHFHLIKVISYYHHCQLIQSKENPKISLIFWKPIVTGTSGGLRTHHSRIWSPIWSTPCYRTEGNVSLRFVMVYLVIMVYTARNGRPEAYPEVLAWQRSLEEVFPRFREGAHSR